MKKINEEKVDVLVRAFHMASPVFDVDVYLKHDIFENNYNLELEVNWCSLGQVDTKKAIMFAKNLKKTSEMVELINSLGLEVERTEHSIYKSKNERIDDLSNIYEMVLNHNVANLIAWLLA